MTRDATSETTLIEQLRARARLEPNALYSRHLFAGRAPVETSFAGLESRTRSYASAYRAAHVHKGDVVLVILEHHEDLMPAFLGAMWLGAIPAFLPTPTPKMDPKRYFSNLRALIARTTPAAVMTHDMLRQPIADAIGGESSCALLASDDVGDAPGAPEPAEHNSDDVALIQYSSGSTGLQKGAALSHRAILAEIRGVNEFFEMTRADSFLTWVPLYHDWGLVCVALHSIVLGASFTLMSPIDWVSNPALACRAIHDWRPTIYYQPNFAFNLMTRRVKDKDLEGIDLSSVRICCNGAEPCFFDSHEMFARRFEPAGFRRESLSIVYGMAEVTNSVIAAGHREPIVVDDVDRFVLQREQRAQPTAEDDPKRQRFLGVGRALLGTEYRVVDDARNELPDRSIGEVAIRSDARMHGYFGNPEATRRSLAEDGWYYSGDMGYRVGERLFITGRKSDMMILGGVNIYPQDVENIIAEHPEVVGGRVAAIGVDDSESGTQKMIVIVESKSTDPAVLADIARHARAEVANRLQVVISRLVHAPYMWLIKTSSGKIARLPNLRRIDELTGGAQPPRP
jgi:fatty-acyl-CoA synthase